VRRLLTVTIAALLVAAAAGANVPAHAGDPASKYKLTERVVAAARMLATHPRFRSMPESKREKTVEFITGNLIFVLGHEAGHAVIREMDIPVTGREEDAADIFATLMALMCTDAFADRVLASAALGWFLSDRRDRRQGEKMEYYDEHGIDLQRAYNIVCLMVGSSMTKFAGIATAAKLPAERQESCAHDYLSAAWSWDNVLKAHLRKPDQPKTALNIVYGPVGGKQNTYAEVARQIKLLEAIADTLSDRFVWPAPISLEMQTCDEPNARWELRTKRVIVCYELADEFAELYRQYGHTMAFSLDPKVAAASTPGREAVAARKQKASFSAMNGRRAVSRFQERLPDRAIGTTPRQR
jgi:hypothetical protein